MSSSPPDLNDSKQRPIAKPKPPSARPSPRPAPLKKAQPLNHSSSKNGNGHTARPPLPVSQPASQPANQPARQPTNQPVPSRPIPASQQPTPIHGARQTAEAPREDDEQEEHAGGTRFLLFNAVPSWMVSMVIHAMMLLVLALLTMTNQVRHKTEIIAAPEEEKEKIEEVSLEQLNSDVDLQPSLESEIVAESAMPEVPNTVEDISVSQDIDMAAVQVELSDVAERVAPRSDLLKTVGALAGAGIDGRGAAMRGKMLQKYGGTPASENAVKLALEWLAAHQLPDGGWNFDHTAGACGGRCNHPGTLPAARNSATAMALLPFLGAGHTHVEGKYKKTVQDGLYFLLKSIKADGSFMEPGGRMYGHGLCAITLCEAYAMTHDKSLMGPAQLSLNYIVYAQDPVGGGWRYSPKQPGDTSVVGWQLMALKSGHMAYLVVPPETIRNAIKFLDSVQADSGSKYGYTAPGAGIGTTSVGLLCRMYTGWKHDHPALERGVRYLASRGPSPHNMYFNYYATQVLRHYDGDIWKKWNVKMRDGLIATQSKAGHEKGSWYMAGGHGMKGGRLYCTSMAAMILEVYYRHMPIYGKQAAEDDFPL